MPLSNIRWRGYPHRHLPRVHSTSIRRVSIASKSATRCADEEVFRSPLGAALRRTRRKQRQRASIRRIRSSRRSSTVGVRTFGRCGRRSWVRSKTNLAVPTARNPGKLRFGFEDSTNGDGNQTSQPPLSSSDGTVLDFENNDGARSSHALKKKEHEPNEVHSMMRVTQGPPNNYKWGSKNQRSGNKIGEYAHLGPIDADDGNQSVRYVYPVGRGRIYNSRNDFNSRHEDTKAVLHPRPTTVNHIISASNINQKPMKKIRSTDFDDASIWETIESMRFGGDGSIPSSRTLRSLSATFTVPYRTRSQTKKLTRFTKELELHYTAVSNLPKGCLLATPSTTTISAKTLQDLIPFHAQFRSAGLAVTSAEQERGMKEKNNISSCFSTIADRRAKPAFANDGPGSYASGSTGTTVLGFTPPHEKTYGFDGKDRARDYSTGSDYTAVGFTPPHEKMMSSVIPEPIQPAPVPRPGSLRWLERQDPSLSPGRLSNTSAPSNQYRRKGYSLQSAETLQAPQATSAPLWVPRLSTKLRWNSLKYGDADQADESLNSMNHRLEAATQTDQPPNYLDAITQTLEDYSHKFGGSPLDTFSPLRAQTFLCTADEPLRNNKITNQVYSKDYGYSRRSRLPWERQKPNSDSLTVHDGQDHKRPTIRANNHNAENPFQWSYQDEGSKTSSSPVPIPKFTRCRCALTASTEDLDREVQSNSTGIAANDARCAHCPPSVYTAYVVPPSHYRSVSRQSGRVRTEGVPRDVEDQTAAVQIQSEQQPEDVDRAPATSSTIDSSEHSIVEFTKAHPGILPMKRPSMHRIKPDASIDPDSDGPRTSSKASRTQRTHRKHHQKSAHYQNARHTNASSSGARHLSSTAVKRPGHSHDPTESESRPLRDHKMVHSSLPSSQVCSRACQKITNQEVFNGLQIATAAACDKEFDKWISEINGSGVRHFLADLSKFEPLGVNALARVAKNAAIGKREQIRAFERARNERLEARLHKIQAERYNHQGKNIHRGLVNEIGGTREIHGLAGGEEGEWLLDSELRKQRKVGVLSREGSHQ